MLEQLILKQVDSGFEEVALDLKALGNDQINVLDIDGDLELDFLYNGNNEEHVPEILVFSPNKWTTKPFQDFVV